MFFYELLHMDIPVLVNQQELTYNNSTQTKEQWMIGIDGEEESRKSMLAVWLDDDDDDDGLILIIYTQLKYSYNLHTIILFKVTISEW